MNRKRAHAVMLGIKRQVSLNAMVYTLAGGSVTPRSIANVRQFGQGAPRFAQKFVLPTELVGYFGDSARRRDSAKIVYQSNRFEKITSSQLYDELHGHFRQGKSWKSTGYIDRWQQRLREAGPIDGMFSTDDILRRCSRLDAIWEQLNAEKLLRINRNRFYWDGIRINVVAGNGFLHAREGLHRMVLAKLCGVKHIPVEVGLVDARIANSFQSHVELVQREAGAGLRDYLRFRR